MLNSNNKILTGVLSKALRVSSICNASTGVNIKPETVNPCIRNMKFEVRGPLLIRAMEIQEELKKGIKKPYDNVIRVNIGDCHATGQKPITFLRQVVAACTYPELMKDDLFPADVKERAKTILECCDGKSLGAYSTAHGIECLRKAAAEFIGQRDGIACDYNSILTCGGGTDAIRSVIKILANPSSEKKTGIMIPVPQYPLYSAAITENDCAQVNYILDEEHDWGMNVEELEKAYNAAKSKCNPRAIVVMNPGNPTGQVLLRKDVENVIKFAYDHKLTILADEVYQMNVYVDDRSFVSFRKCLLEMGPPYSDMELVSFFSASKGFMGECGARGGYFECLNFHPAVFAELVKLLSVPLCPSVWGQALMYATLKPPKENEPSYELFKLEKKQVLRDLRTKAELTTELLNKLEGVKCNKVMGAMYAFPQLTLPQEMIKEAEKKNIPADTFYCREILENAGICILPGTGFLQRPGTYHFRTTILPPVDEIRAMLNRLSIYHSQLLSKYK